MVTNYNKKKVLNTPFERTNFFLFFHWFCFSLPWKETVKKGEKRDFGLKFYCKTRNFEFDFQLPVCFKKSDILHSAWLMYKEHTEKKSDISIFFRDEKIRVGMEWPRWWMTFGESATWFLQRVISTKEDNAISCFQPHCFLAWNIP